MISIGIDGERSRLMIADDDDVIRSMLSMALDKPFEVVGVAADADQAIELASELQPDAALIDVEMPKGGGMAAVRGIVEVSPRTAIVILSTDESDHVVRELIEAGAVSYQRKGVPARMIVGAIRQSIQALASEQGTISVQRAAHSRR